MELLMHSPSDKLMNQILYLSWNKLFSLYQTVT